MAPAIPLGSVVIDTNEPDDIDLDHDVGQIGIPLEDGAVVINLADHRDADEEKDSRFDDNLALKMDAGALATIANDLIEGIEADIASRSQWEATYTQGIDLLGLKLETPRGDVGTSSSPLEGMSTVRHPLLLEAVLRSQANASGELLPSSGPAKIDNDGDETQAADDQAEFLEKDFNHYLTKVATEYYPDTRRTLFWSAFGGSGFKKLYHCPLRRRPVSESVDAKDLIVSNNSTDLVNAPRITHRIPMRPSVMKRMQILGVYRDVALGQPTTDTPRIDAKIESTTGVTKPNDRPQDEDFTLYETIAELIIDRWAPTQFKGKALPLPYKITIDKDSREILELRRFWKENDAQCQRKKRIVKYPYVEALGIYGVGLLHILGNSTRALTAAWREMLDAGMFASFPGFLYAKGAGKQLSNEFRIPPGGGMGIDTGNIPLNQAVMPLPYHDVTAGLLGLTQNINEATQRVGGTAEMPVGEGTQNAPVGTTLALIEQATKVESAVHKGLHAAQAEEFEIFLELFREDPESFWEHNKECSTEWDEQKLLAALENCKLVPASDPNVPSHMHRIAKALAAVQLMQTPQFQGLLDPKDVLALVLRMGKIDLPVQTPSPQQAPPDPNMIAAQAKLISAQTNQQKAAADAQNAQQETQLRQAEMASEREVATTNFAKELVIHQHDVQGAQQQQQQAAQDQQMQARQQALQANQQAHEQQTERTNQSIQAIKTVHDMAMAHREHQLAITQAAADAQDKARQHALDRQQALMQGAQAQRQHAFDFGQGVEQANQARRSHALDVLKAAHDASAKMQGLINDREATRTQAETAKFAVKNKPKPAAKPTSKSRR